MLCAGASTVDPRPLLAVLMLNCAPGESEFGVAVTAVLDAAGGGAVGTADTASDTRQIDGRGNHHVSETVVGGAGLVRATAIDAAQPYGGRILRSPPHGGVLFDPG